MKSFNIEQSLSLPSGSLPSFDSRVLNAALDCSYLSFISIDNNDDVIQCSKAQLAYALLVLEEEMGSDERVTIGWDHDSLYGVKLQVYRSVCFPDGAEAQRSLWNDFVRTALKTISCDEELFFILGSRLQLLARV